MDIKSQINEVLNYYQSLKYDSDSNSIYGELTVCINDTYEICLVIGVFPLHFPSVFETGERIPPTVDRHIYSNSKACCFSTSANAQILLKTKIKTLLDFIKEIVIPYFINNTFYEINGFYADSTYSHGVDGIIEGYKDILQLPKDTNDYLIAQILIRRFKGENLNIRDKCYCGSGTVLKKCQNGKHDIAYRRFKLIEKELLINDYNKIMQEKYLELF
jgi:hypothetical protein